MNNWGNSYVEATCRHYAPRHIVVCAAELLKSVGDVHFAEEHNETVASGVKAAFTQGGAPSKKF